ncbi:hypothetical protein YSA_05604 [Pseudomonas putida ND6]|uniref:Uncharacterized protein n=1 Tax=Pseudomonas putida ND6 TaxID=231023 RepID=I3UWD3_PSEPU|nr:hypothetical protein YSA_05604 [Pseudomonas putida ND6]
MLIDGVDDEHEAIIKVAPRTMIMQIFFFTFSAPVESIFHKRAQTSAVRHLT